MKSKVVAFVLLALLNTSISVAQHLVSVTGNVSFSNVNHVSMHSLALELKSLSVISLRPGLEYERRVFFDNYWNQKFYMTDVLYLPITYGVRPIPKLSINSTLGIPLTNNITANTDVYFRMGVDYLLNKHLQLGGNFKYSPEFDFYPRYSLSASYIINDYYKSSQRYANKIRKRYNNKKGSGAFERELEASLDKKDYHVALGISTNISSFIFINSLNMAATLTIQKAGARGALYQFKIIKSDFLVFDFINFNRYRYVGPGVFIGEHRTNEKIQFYHGADFAMLFSTNRIASITQRYPVIGYKLGLATGNWGIKNRLRIDGNLSINTLGVGAGFELAYLLK